MSQSRPSLSSMRLYGSAIALVSGSYSIYLATTGLAMSASAWLMLTLGGIVFVHGVALLTPVAGRLGTLSGPLMIGYAIVMLANQVWMASDVSSTVGGMGSTMMNGGMGPGSMAWDPGMVAVATLMLASGVIMTARSDVMEAGTAAGDGM